jgi:hypothetical protein
MPDVKIKTYKNPERNKPDNHKSYVPQYQIMGVEPDDFKGAIVPDSYKSNHNPTADNPRIRPQNIRQPYAESTDSPVGRGKGPVPNVGNNMEHTWSSVNGEIIDDLTNLPMIDSDHEMIDNNDYVSDAAFGTAEELPSLDEVKTPPTKSFMSQKDLKKVISDNDDINSIIFSLSESDYLLIVDGVSVCSGPMAEVQEQARLLVFGEHKLCDGNPVPIDDIIIIKRVPIKVGLFLE